MKQRLWQVVWRIFPGCCSAAAIAVLLKLNAFNAFEQIAYRSLFQTRGSRTWDDRIVLVQIDEKSLKHLGQFPWSRHYYTQLLNVLSTAQPNVVAIDLLWAESSPQDAALAKAMTQQGHTILAQAWDQMGVPIQPVASLTTAAIATGHVLTRLDTDGLVRQMDLQIEEQPALAVTVAQVYSLVIHPVSLPNLDQSLWINWVSPAAKLPAYSFVDVIQGKVPAQVFHNKIVLVGVTAVGLDVLVTPFDQNPPTSSVYLHATILNNLLQQTPLRPLHGHLVWFWLLLFSAPGLSWLLSNWNTRQKLIGIFGLCCGWFLISLILFQWDYWLPTAAPVTLFVATAACVALRDRLQEDYLLRRQIAYLWRHYQTGLGDYAAPAPDSPLPGLDQKLLHPRQSLLQVTQLAALADQLGRSQKALQQAKELALQEAQISAAANDAKSEFLANMSHELRTPLNVILGFTQVISHDTTLDPQHQEHLHIIKRSGQHLLGLINDVLEMSKIEAGRVRLQETRFNLYQLLDDLERMLQVRVESKPLVLRFERSPTVPQFISTDEGKLRQVLLNLLGNAIKFTPRGQVGLCVTATPQLSSKYAHDFVDREFTPPESQPCSTVTATGSTILRFEVTDTGLGIAPEDLLRVFQPFTQAAAGQQSGEGTGLGLSISQKYVHLMGGEITVSSAIAQGSTFKFQIQVQPVSAREMPLALKPERVIAIAPGQPRYRILIVEDHAENRQFLTTLLTPLGFEVCTALNGAEGVDLWQQWQPDVILMDIRMPVMDGVTAIQKIRALEQQQHRDNPQPSEQEGEPVLVQAAGQCSSPAHTKIIVLTASAFTDTRSTALEMGCDDFLSKPIQENLLLAKLGVHLNVRFLYESPAAQVRRDYSGVPVSITELQIALAQMPQPWIEQLHQAAVKGRDELILKLIEHMPPTQSALATVLSDWVSCFQFDDILNLTRSRIDNE
jgi:signal transduction histidine kinase/CheY-like chemotaxis protein